MRRKDKKLNMSNVNILTEGRYLVTENSINGKYGNKKSIINAILNIFKIEKVEGRYHDEHWAGISKLKKAFEIHGIDYDFISARYEHIHDSNTKLPNMKVYEFNLSVRDKNEKEYVLPLKVTCSFVGRTGTSEDDVYELTYYFMT